jgi:hypothetical protein
MSGLPAPVVTVIRRGVGLRTTSAAAKVLEFAVPGRGRRGQARLPVGHWPDHGRDPSRRLTAVPPARSARAEVWSQTEAQQPFEGQRVGRHLNPPR